MKPSFEYTEYARPVSAINKLTKIKKNVFPKIGTNINISMYQGTGNNMPETSPNLAPITNQNSSIIHTRIKSAHPLNYDKEKIYEENLTLKNEINKIKKELNFTKKENYNLELELNKKDKMLEDLAVDTQNSMINQIEKVGDLFNQNKLLNKATETHLILNLKKQFKELKKEFNKKVNDLEELKKTLKNTKMNEITLENKILSEEIGKLKTLYEFSLQQNSNNEKNIRDFLQLKENFSKQEFIIVTLQENLKKMQDEYYTKEEELNKVNKTLNDKLAQITKLKKDLKFQYQINERLIMSSGGNNIKQSNEYIAMKSEMDKKLSEYKKDNLYYKDLAEKRERKIKELEGVLKGTGTNLNLNNNLNNNLNSNTRTVDENPEEKTNHTILLLKSRLQETIKERDYFKNMNQELNYKLSQVSKTPLQEESELPSQDNKLNNLTYSTGVNNANPYSNTNPNNYEYLSEFHLNELIYILIKNFEANRIDVNIIEERVLKDGHSTSLLPILKSNEKEFSDKLTNNILNLLKIKQEKDKFSVFSFVKTFVHNYYNIEESGKNVEEFKKKFLALFESITFYPPEQRNSLNLSLYKKINKYKSLLYNAITFYDENKTGYITFLVLRKILEQIKIKLSNNLIEYFIFLMKSFNDENSSIHDLKYENLFKIFKEREGELDDAENEEEDEIDQDEEEVDPNDDEESAIEISSDEYLRKVSNVIKKIAFALSATNTKLDDHFVKFIQNVRDDATSDQSFRAVELAQLVQILNEEFNIILDSIDIYCLFTKLRHVESDGEGEVEEIVDYDKLVREVESYIKENQMNLGEFKKNNNNDLEDNRGENLNFKKSKSNVSNNSKIEAIIEKIPSKSENNIENADLDNEHDNDKFIIHNNKKDDSILKNEIDIPSEDFIQIIKNHLNKNVISFEEFFEPLQNKIKIEKSEHSNNSSRFVNINSLENFLLTKEVIVTVVNPTNQSKLQINKSSYSPTVNENLLCNGDRINLDYLKLIIENKLGQNGNEYVTFDSNKKYEEEFHQNQENKVLSSKKSKNTESSESFKKLEKELLDEEDVYDENMIDEILGTEENKN